MRIENTMEKKLMDVYEEKLIKRYASNHPLPTILYHYTSQDGLLGILNDSKIWATNILYLNDEAEFIYSANLIESDIKTTIKSLNAPVTKRTKKIFEEMLDQSWILEHFQIFVCSFSANGNLLSQWRGYCPDNNGFSIGFDYFQLQEIIKSQEFVTFHLLPCFYERVEHESIIKELKKELFSNVINCLKEDNSDELENVLENYTRYYLLLSSIIKDGSFSEEKEWRVFCLKNSFDNHPEILFRKGKTMVLPYLAIDLQKAINDSPIQQIYIGPTQHKELSKQSVKLLLKSKEVDCIVKNSDIPYRAW